MKRTKKKKDILTVCLECGNREGKAKGGSIGVWYDTCNICGKKGVPCASAPHDFGIYSSKEIEIADRVQRKI